MNDAAARAQQLGQLGLIGLQALARRNPGNQEIRELISKAGLIPTNQESAVIDNAQKPAALVRFTFLDSLRKLAATSMPTGPVGAVTPPAQP
jgi:hypothetical protein